MYFSPIWWLLPRTCLKLLSLAHLPNTRQLWRNLIHGHTKENEVCVASVVKDEDASEEGRCFRVRTSVDKKSVKWIIIQQLNVLRCCSSAMASLTSSFLLCSWGSDIHLRTINHRSSRAWVVLHWAERHADALVCWSSRCRIWRFSIPFCRCKIMSQRSESSWWFKKIIFVIRRDSIGSKRQTYCSSWRPLLSLSRSIAFCPCSSMAFHSEWKRSTALKATWNFCFLNLKKSLDNSSESDFA